MPIRFATDIAALAIVAIMVSTWFVSRLYLRVPMAIETEREGDQFE